jgi:hypothetical protein
MKYYSIDDFFLLIKWEESRFSFIKKLADRHFYQEISP